MALTKVIGSGIGSFELTEDTAAGNNASIGFTSTEGLILTGQGSTNDITIKNDADAAILNVATGTTTASFPGQVSSSVGQSTIPEFISNLYLAGNTSDAAELQSCFSSTYSVYRLIGVVGGSHSGEANTKFRFLTGTDTQESTGWYGVGRSVDDSQTLANSAEANGNAVTINQNQSSTGFSIIDMHLYMQPNAFQLIGMAGYHDQSSDRGVQYFGYKNDQGTAKTGFRLFNNQSNNMSAVNFSVYGYRIRQNASSKMTGSYS